MKENIIIHVASINGNPCAGAESAVLNHIKYQSKYAKMLLLNVSTYDFRLENESYKVENFENIKSIDRLNVPFNKPDLIIFHSIYYVKYLKIAKQANKLNIPYVVVPHGGLQFRAQRTKKVKKILGNIFLFNSFLRNASAIQYLCLGEKNNSVNKNNKYFISGNGFELVEQQKTYHNKKNNDKFELIFVGRYNMYFKGLDLMIESINCIKDFMRKNNIIVSLYGKIYLDYEKVKKMVCDYKIDDIVLLNDGVYGEDKILKLLNADVFIQTSRSEGQPLGIIEAISLGLPCILTKGTNFGEIVEKEGIGWVSDFSVENLCQVIREAFIQREKLPEMSRKAVNYARENLLWEKVSQNAVYHYEEIIENKKRG